MNNRPSKTTHFFFKFTGTWVFSPLSYSIKRKKNVATSFVTAHAQGKKKRRPNPLLHFSTALTDRPSFPSLALSSTGSQKLR